MAPNLRQADLHEIAAGSGQPPVEALLSSFEGSTERFCIEHAGEPIAVFGGGPLEMCSDSTVTVGVPWMLGTDGISKHWVWFLRNTPEIVNLVQQHYDVLFNLVDVRNEVHIRWLKWCGFSFGKVIPHGQAGEPFQEFIRFQNV